MAPSAAPATPDPLYSEAYRLRCRTLLRKLGAAAAAAERIELHYYPLWFPGGVNRPNLARGLAGTIVGAIITDCEQFIDEAAAERQPNFYAELKALRADADPDVRRGVALLLEAYRERKGFRLEDTWL